MTKREFGYIIIGLLYTVVHGRHLDKERDYSRCSSGFIPIGIKNADGFLILECIKPRCDEITRVKEVCVEAYTSGCPKGSWVGSIHREFKGNNEKSEYKTRCCTHPIFQRTVAVVPLNDFQPGEEAKDGGAGQGNVIDIVTNVLPNSEFDRHNVELTTVVCGSTTTSTSTVRPTTQRTKTDRPRNNNPNNGGGGGGTAGDNSGNNGGNNNGNQGKNSHGPPQSEGSNGGGSNNGDGGKGGGSKGKGGGSKGKGGGSKGKGGGSGGKGGSSPECGPTGCHDKLEGGERPEYHPVKGLPPPAKPPPTANDPKSWGIGNTPGGGSGCFSADTLVHTRHGDKRMDQLNVGDEVLSSISWDGNSAVSYQPITQFIHKDPSVRTPYTVISTLSGRSLSLTPYHLLPQFDCQFLEHSSMSSRDYELLFTESARFAKKARPGRCVLVVDSDGKLIADRIGNVTTQVRQGVFSPITASGIIVANGVQASCYSSVENHALQHAFFSFMHKITQTMQPYVDYAKQLFYGTSIPHVDDGQIPTLLRVMLVLSDMVIGSF